MQNLRSTIIITLFSAIIIQVHGDHGGLLDDIGCPENFSCAERSRCSCAESQDNDGIGPRSSCENLDLETCSDDKTHVSMILTLIHLADPQSQC